MAVSLAPKMGMDNVLSTSGLHNQSKLPRSPLAKVSNLHVIFLFQWGFGGKVDFGFSYTNEDQFYVYTHV
jgi:hypothetical protein